MQKALHSALLQHAGHDLTDVCLRSENTLLPIYARIRNFQRSYVDERYNCASSVANTPFKGTTHEDWMLTCFRIYKGVSHGRSLQT